MLPLSPATVPLFASLKYMLFNLTADIPEFDIFQFIPPFTVLYTTPPSPQTKPVFEFMKSIELRFYTPAL